MGALDYTELGNVETDFNQVGTQSINQSIMTGTQNL